MNTPIEPPFYKRVRAELDASERRAMLRDALWMVLGCGLFGALSWILWIILP